MMERGLDRGVNWPETATWLPEEAKFEDSDAGWPHALKAAHIVMAARRRVEVFSRFFIRRSLRDGYEASIAMHFIYSIALKTP
jgi:hypothetical protein